MTTNYERYKDRYLRVYASDGWLEDSFWGEILDTLQEENGLNKRADSVKLALLESAHKRRMIDKKEFDIYKDTRI